MSTLRELYDDFTAAIRLYTEHLPVTEIVFLRYLSRGLQLFQRETELAEATLAISRDANGDFTLPEWTARLVQVQDKDNVELLIQDYRQLERTRHVTSNRIPDTPLNYGRRVRYPGEGISGYASARLVTQYNRRLLLFPDLGDTVLRLYFIPAVQPFSSAGPQWTDFFPLASNFKAQFDTRRLAAEFHDYEKAMMDYAVAEFIKSAGNANYRVYEQSFWEEVERAKINKPVLFREGVADYFMSPYS